MASVEASTAVAVESRDDWGNIDKAPAGPETAAAVGKYGQGSCGRRHCYGSGEIKTGLLREQTVLRQRGNKDRAPAGADRAAAVGNI